MSPDSLLQTTISSYFVQVATATGKLQIEPIVEVIKRLEEARLKGQTVFTCGNGGSAATAMHFATDLAKGGLVPGKPPVRAFCLCENLSLLTAWANDSSYEDSFSRPMELWLRPEDVLVAISCSGNSGNVLRAVSRARAAGAATVALTGFQGGKLARMADISIVVPSESMEQIEDIHMLLCHLMATALRILPPVNGNGNGVDGQMGHLSGLPSPSLEYASEKLS